MSHPYRRLPDTSFWSRSVPLAPPGGLDPLIGAPFRISPEMQVATMGSCFAQHIARHLSRSGLKYMVTEPGPVDKNYGVFTARFANIYTTRQAVQMFDRAYGRFSPEEDVWAAGDAFVDPFRPTVEPGGFSSVEALHEDREKHFAAIRDMFENADVLVFTLGLTEGWRSKIDGAMLAAAPGVSGGKFDPERHEAVNLTTAEVRSDLEDLRSRLHGVNPTCKIILTVSPVPLIATNQARHVVASTSYSKAALLAAAVEFSGAHDDVAYFPSYEIITSSHSRGAYFEADLRSVRPEGVAHVMRTFTRHFVDGAGVAQTARLEARAGTDDIVCDEEEIERAMAATGMA